MPKGIILMRWDERYGAEAIFNFPQDASLQEKTLMQIYSQHEFTGLAGFVSLTVGSTNIISYYNGPDFKYYMILLLMDEEDGEIFEDILLDINREMQHIIDNKEMLKSYLINSFQRLTMFPVFTEEQKLGYLVQDEVKFMILNRLREELVLPTSEIEIWLRDQYKQALIFDIEGIIKSFVKAGICKIMSFSSGTSELVFLQDIRMLRTVPIELLKDPIAFHLPKSLKEIYLKAAKDFFSKYKVSDEDSLNLIKYVLLNPQNYEVIKLLRQAIVTRNDLEKLKKKGVQDVDIVVQMLQELKLITIMKDEGKIEYFGLISDFKIEKYYPLHNLNLIAEKYKNKSLSPSVLLKTLDMMEEEFWSIKNGNKTKTNGKEKKENKKQENKPKKEKKAKKENTEESIVIE